MPLVSGTPKSLLSPAFICSTPSPRDVPMPPMVANSAKMSMSLPNHPLAPLSPMRGINMELIRAGFPLRNCMNARPRVSTA